MCPVPQIKPLRSLFVADTQHTLALCKQASSTLGHSIGIARRVLGDMKATLGKGSCFCSCARFDLVPRVAEESPVGTIMLLRDMESRLVAADALAGSQACGKRARKLGTRSRSSHRPSSASSPSRRASVAVAAREIAVQRAREKVVVMVKHSEPCWNPCLTVAVHRFACCTKPRQSWSSWSSI